MGCVVWFGVCIKRWSLSLCNIAKLPRSCPKPLKSFIPFFQTVVQTTLYFVVQKHDRMPRSTKLHTAGCYLPPEPSCGYKVRYYCPKSGDFVPAPPPKSSVATRKRIPKAKRTTKPAPAPLFTNSAPATAARDIIAKRNRAIRAEVLRSKRSKSRARNKPPTAAVRRIVPTRVHPSAAPTALARDIIAKRNRAVRAEVLRSKRSKSRARNIKQPPVAVRRIVPTQVHPPAAPAAARRIIPTQVPPAAPAAVRRIIPTQVPPAVPAKQREAAGPLPETIARTLLDKYIQQLREKRTMAEVWKSVDPLIKKAAAQHGVRPASMMRMIAQVESQLTLMAGTDEADRFRMKAMDRVVDRARQFVKSKKTSAAPREEDDDDFIDDEDDDAYEEDFIDDEDDDEDFDAVERRYANIREEDFLAARGRLGRRA